jgi:hypothetical protein
MPGSGFYAGSLGPRWLNPEYADENEPTQRTLEHNHITEWDAQRRLIPVPTGCKACTAIIRLRAAAEEPA